MICLQKYFKNEDGATSVLVIFMLIVLVALGSFAITSANVNFKLGSKTTLWNSHYYELEKYGEEMLANIDYYLYQSEVSAVDYIKNKNYTNSSYDGLGDAMQQKITADFIAAQNKSAYLEKLMTQLYSHYLTENLAALQKEFPDVIVTLKRTKNGLIDFTGTFIQYEIDGAKTASEQNKNHLDIKLTLNNISYSIRLNEDEVQGIRLMDSLYRYKIVSYREWQTPFEYNETEQLLNPNDLIEIIE